MANKLPQKRRFTDAEFETIKHTFADNEELLKAIRKSFLQLDLSAGEQAMLTKAFSNESVFDVVSKAFLPKIDADAPLGQIVDLWLTVKLDDKSPNDAYPHLMAREILIQFVEQQLHELKGNRGLDGITLDSLVFNAKKDPEEAYSELLARTIIVSHVEQMIFQLQTLAGQKTETVEETLKRIEKDSTK